MNHMRQNLPLEPDWQGSAMTGCWQIGYYLDDHEDFSIQLIQPITPISEWLFDCYSESHRRRLPAKTVEFVEQLPSNIKPIVSKVTFTEGKSRPEGYYSVEQDKIEELINAARIWNAKQ